MQISFASRLHESTTTNDRCAKLCTTCCCILPFRLSSFGSCLIVIVLPRRRRDRGESAESEATTGAVDTTERPTPTTRTKQHRNGAHQQNQHNRKPRAPDDTRACTVQELFACVVFPSVCVIMISCYIVWCEMRIGANNDSACRACVRAVRYARGVSVRSYAAEEARRRRLVVIGIVGGMRARSALIGERILRLLSEITVRRRAGARPAASARRRASAHPRRHGRVAGPPRPRASAHTLPPRRAAHS
jgi:hypothetical protein